MAVFKAYTHTIFKNEDLTRYLINEQMKNEMEISHAIKVGRAEDGKNPENLYYICNVGEPYADKVLQVILAGEDEKAGIMSQPLTLEKLEQMDGSPAHSAYKGWGIIAKRYYEDEGLRKEIPHGDGFPVQLGMVRRCYAGRSDL